MMARVMLTGGPFDGEEAFQLPPDTAAPAQIVWSGWSPQGFTAWLYEWHGETTTTGAYVEALVYRPTGRRLAPDEIPYAVLEAAEMWVDGADLMLLVSGFPAGDIWPGV
jgi:hypothetical protein